MSAIRIAIGAEVLYVNESPEVACLINQLRAQPEPAVEECYPEFFRDFDRDAEHCGAGEATRWDGVCQM